MIGILGAGITGLTLGHLLSRQGHEVVVLEAASRAGGNIGSIREEGFLMERGPNSLRMNQQIYDLVEELGLIQQVRYADKQAKKRFILKGGHFKAIPMGPLALLSNGFFGWGTVGRILKERKVAAEESEFETVDSFFRRRFGEQVADYLVAPFVSGIYAGDPKALLLAEAFPQLKEMERNHGSVLRGFFKGRKKGGPKGIFSFENGLQDLVNALVGKLGDRLRLNSEVTSLRPAGDGWALELEGETLQLSQVVSTLPAQRLAPLLDSWQPNAAKALRQINYPPVSVVHLGYNREDVGHALDGFGALNNHLEDHGTLGIIFASSIFPERAPGNKVLLTTMVGGSRQPERARLPDDKLLELVSRDHQELLQTKAAPVFQKVIRWDRAIPQYDRAWLPAKAAAEELENQGLLLGGNWYGGISVPSCLEKAQALCEQLGPPQH